MNNDLPKPLTMQSRTRFIYSKQVVRIKTVWLITLMYLLTACKVMGQQKLSISKSDAAIMEAAIIHMIERDLAYDTIPAKTIVLDRQVTKKSLDAIDLNAFPDSIIMYGFSYGVEGLVQLIHNDSSWVKLIRTYNQRSEEISLVRKGALKLERYDIKLISNRAINRMFKKAQGWDHFYRKFSGTKGLFRVSSPVVDEDKAILYLSHSKGPLNGVGYVVLLWQEQGWWKVIQRVELWVS